MNGDLLKQIECITYKVLKGKCKHSKEGRKGV